MMCMCRHGNHVLIEKGSIYIHYLVNEDVVKRKIDDGRRLAEHRAI